MEMVAAVESELRRLGIKPGQRAPSERELARALRLSRYQANRAVLQLIERGILARSGYKLRLAGARGEARRGSLRILAEDPESEFCRGALEEGVRAGMECEVRGHATEAEIAAGIVAAIREGAGGIVVGRGLVRPTQAVRLAREAGVLVVGLEEDWGQAVLVGEDNHAGMRLAVEHLARLGHAELGFVTFRDSRGSLEERRRGYLAACIGAGFMTSGREERVLAARSVAEVEAALGAYLRKEGTVTGLVCASHPLTAGVIAAARAHGLEVPADLSVVGHEHDRITLRHQPSLTELDPGERRLGALAAGLVARWRGDESPDGAERMALRLEPRLIEGYSTGKCRPVRPRPRQRPRPLKVEGRPEDAQWRAWPAGREERVAAARRVAEDAYPMALQNRGGRWLPLDLGGVANRSWDREGETWFVLSPRVPLPRGVRRVHGVPFEFREEKLTAPYSAAVISRAPEVGLTEASFSVPVGAKVRALYWLHAAVWVRDASVVLEIGLRYRRARPARIDLVAAGPAAAHDMAAPAANIQDWWPTYLQLNNRPGARCFPLTLHGDPYLGCVYFYTLQWINPKPGAPLARVDFTMPKSSSSAYALVGMTALVD